MCHVWGVFGVPVLETVITQKFWPSSCMPTASRNPYFMGLSGFRALRNSKRHRQNIQIPEDTFSDKVIAKQQISRNGPLLSKKQKRHPGICQRQGTLKTLEKQVKHGGGFDFSFLFASIVDSISALQYIYIYAVVLITWPFFGQSWADNLAMVELITWPSFFEPIKIVFFWEFLVHSYEGVVPN